MDIAIMHERILQHVAMHISLTPHEKTFFTGLLKPRSFRRRQFLLQAGDVCRHESFLVSGCMHAYYTDRNGDDHVLHFAIEDWWISDFQSFLDGKPAQINIEALEPTWVLQLDHPGLESLYREVPAFERFFRILHQNAYLAQNQRILNNISQTAPERYEAFLERYPQLAERVPQKYLASYLGMTPVFLSQIRKKRMGS